ncbi:hypothetical protein ACFWM7_01560 [Streptomyces sp. NPDC058375]|uniref:hypothetical protein n=1 Tax=Streptomyces sp. NPDC058375 TaxID=3346467 RepID=UPI003657DFBB
MPTYYSSFGSAAGAAMESNARMAAEHAAQRAAEEHRTHTTILIPAREIRRGDEFDLHRHTRTAAYNAVKTIRGSVRVALADGGEAYLPADHEIRVSRPTGECLCATG